MYHLPLGEFLACVVIFSYNFYYQAQQDSDKGAVGSGIFEFEESDTFEEPIPKPTIKLNGVRVRLAVNSYQLANYTGAFLMPSY